MMREGGRGELKLLGDISGGHFSIFKNINYLLSALVGEADEHFREGRPFGLIFRHISKCYNGLRVMSICS